MHTISTFIFSYFILCLQATESKASPLALLAATCSSIGKTDAEKKDLKTTTTSPIIVNKLSPSKQDNNNNNINKKPTSFKPYKLDNSSHNKRSSPTSITSTIRSSPPVLVSNTNIVSSKALPKSAVSPDRIMSATIGRPGVNSPGSTGGNNNIKKDMMEEYAKYQEKLNRDLKCHSVSPPLPHLPPKVGMMQPPSAHHPHHHGGNHHHHAHDFASQCRTSSSVTSSAVRRSPHSLHNDIIASAAARSALPPPCSCAMCRSGGDSKCHTSPHHPSLSGVYPHHQSAAAALHSKGFPPPPPPPGMPCRDPGCTNCTKPPKTLTNFVHPALVHQCTHSTPTSHKPGPYPPPPPPPSSYDPYFIKNGLSPHRPKPYVCNWVFEGKHCGSNFVTSEELYQHLRTHTSLQQQRNNENESRASSHAAALSPPNHHGPIPSPTQQSPCNIHGCPCSGGAQRKSPPRSIMPGYPPFGSSAPSGVRYNPYGRPVSAGGNSLPGHFSGSHGMYHY